VEWPEDGRTDSAFPSRADCAGPRGSTALTATFSFNTWNHSVRGGLPPTLPDQIAAAAGAGYQYVGLDVPSLLAHEEQGLHPEQIRDCLKASAIGCFELVPLPISSETTPTEEGLANYACPEVRRMVGYPGQEALTFHPPTIPDYVEEGLLDHVVS